MTITYSLDVANTRFCGFAKLLTRWKGSIYKILWKEFIVFIVGYSFISITYRFYLSPHQQRLFECLVIFFESFLDLIPLSFVLGFYVSLVVGRWWHQYCAIPWPDRLSYMIATYVHGSDDRSRMIRRTLGRYLILMQAFTFQGVSTAVKKRFPTTQHFVAAGIMTKEERTVYESLDATYGKWWLPAQWFCALAMRARKEGRIKDSILLNGLLQEFCNYRSSCGTMFDYDWISVPLVYTQVVTLATYSYSLALMVGRQYLDPKQHYKNHEVDLYVPIFTLLQFFFYVGWLKVAEQIVNPYGEDDDDFELNWCLNRSCQVVYLLVDHFHTKHPKLRKDIYWDEVLPELPQNKITAKNIINPQLGSAFKLEVKPEDAEFLPMNTLMEEDNEANHYASDSVKQVQGRPYRPSFLMNLINSNFGQTGRKRSVQKTDSFREAYTSFSINMEKTAAIQSSSPANSRKSSLAKKSSPSDSRTSSMSFLPSSIIKHRRRSYDMQQIENNLASSTIPECEKSDVSSVISPSVPAIADIDDGMANTNCPTENDTENQKMDSYMPSIPEEPSRVTSVANLQSEILEPDRYPPKQLNNVQALVTEATKVLEELNKAVKSGRHRKECESKGYESCCSLSSDDVSEDEDNETNPDFDENTKHLMETVMMDEPIDSFDDGYKLPDCSKQ